MRIGIDARLYTQTGVGRYIRNLLKELTLLDDKNEYVIYLRKEEYNRVILSNSRWEKKAVDIPWHTVKEQLLFPIVLSQDHLDVVHFPYFNIPVLYNKKYLLTIHDLIVDHFITGRASTLPFILYKIKTLGYKIATTLGIKRASVITTISQTTKKEIIEHYPVEENKIQITYDALDSNFIKVAKTMRPRNYYNFTYLLYVGNAYPHKNLERLIKALKIIKKVKKIKLVLAGNDNYFYPRLQKFVEQMNLSKDVVFFGDADDEDLVSLYTFSECVIFPSLMEGFGLPNFEAIACGRLAVVSDIPVFHELWGNLLFYFDQYDIHDIADKIIKVLQLKPEDYQKRVTEAKKNIDKYNWKITAMQTLKLYESLINK